MTETLQVESRAQLRHEYRTPVNHILGYSELLIEEAHELHLEPFIPVLQQIHSGGRELLDAIQNAFSDDTDSGGDSEDGVFKAHVRALASEVSGTLASLVEDLQCSHRQTFADLDAISWGIKRFQELVDQDFEVLQANRFQSIHGADDLFLQPEPARAERRKGKILIADDDTASRNLLRRRLECEGHEVVEARDGLEVLASLKESACDLVLLDVMMPGMDGFQTLAAIKQEATLREVPVIMVSALDELRNVVRCIEGGAEDYLPKPFNRVLLRARIDASLEKKWLRDREYRKTEELEQTLRLLEQAQEQLAIQASRDALTGLANRRSTEAELDTRIKQGMPFTAIYIDLNGFKKINDTYGHVAGDDLLKQTGERLRRAFRATDVIGRWGGDEFVGLIEGGFPESKSRSRIMECLAGDFVISNGLIHYQVTIGAAVGFAAWRPGDTATKVLHRADLAMYEEKLRIAS